MIRSAGFLICAFLVLIACVAFIACEDSRNPVGGDGSGPAPELTWTLLNPLPTPLSLHDVSFVGRDRALACGDQGLLLATSDGGRTWETVDLGTRASLYDLEFLDSRHGWIVGDSGFVARTFDGGRRWHRVLMPAQRRLTNISALTMDKAWVTVWGSGIAATDDGGKTWDDIFTGYHADWFDLLLVDDQHAWATGYPESYVTHDGGQSWAVEAAGVQGISQDFNLREIRRFPGDGIAMYGSGFLYGGWERYLLISRDFGESWERQRLPNAFSSFAFVTADEIVAVGGVNIAQSVDGGQTWQSRMQLSDGALTAVDASGSRAIAVGRNGRIVWSADGGATWQETSSGSVSPIHEVWFSSERRGFLAGFEGLFRTLDGGVRWERTGPDLLATEMFWLDDQFGWISNTGGDMYRTTDGGDSWFEARQATQWYVYDMHFVDSLNGWNVGFPAAMRTRNGGQTWTVVWVPTGAMNGVHFVDTARGWLCGNLGLIARCTDGEFTWERQSSGLTTDLNAIYFTDSVNGWCVGDRGVLLHTSDGGLNWQLESFYTQSHLYAIQFLDRATGIVVGDGGTVLMTVDGGISWQHVATPAVARLYTAAMLSDRTIWIGGHGGTLYRSD